VDTFNFSFFEDKPAAPPAPAQESPAPNGAQDSSAAPSGTAAAPDTDPFGFDSFGFASDPLAPDALEFDPNAHLALDEMPGFDETQNADGIEEFPDLALTPSLAAPGDFDPLALNDFPASAETLPAPADLFSPTAPTEPMAVEVAALPEEIFALPTGTAALPTEIFAPATPRRRFLTADDPHAEVVPRRERLRVAVLGASGIGLNHARWLDQHAGEVVAFLGSSEESVNETATRLEGELEYAVPGFSDLDALLRETTPQAVCIATPPALHFGQALACLEAGAHVLCEKPLVYIAGRSKRENRDGARELLKTATKKKLVLATQLQYGAATPILCRLAGVTPLEVGDFAMELETVNPRSTLDPKNVWIELGPHPLSIAQFLAGESATLAEETLQVTPSSSAASAEVSVRFGVRCEGGRLLMCRVLVRAISPENGPHELSRRVAFNGRVVGYNGVKRPDGSYIAQYTSPDGYISHYPDPVDFLVGNFVRSCWEDDQLVITPAQGVQNLEWLLAIAEKISA